MESVNSTRHAVWLPFIILGYLETVRRATFYAFGWAGQGQALGIIAFIVVVQIFVENYYPSKFRRVTSTGTGLLYIAFVWLANRSMASGNSAGPLKTLFGLPDFNIGSLEPGYYATFCFFVVFFYALVIFLLTGFVLERKTATEVFTAGVMLMAVEIVTSDTGILVYVAVNTVFGIMLQSQTLLLRMNGDLRVRPAAGTGVDFSTWGGAALAASVLVIVIALMLPAGKSKVNLTSVGDSITRKIVNTRSRIAGSGAHYDHFWGKMEDFDLKGEVPVGDEPVMYVKSPKAAYWRGESMDFYTGSGWQTSLTARPAEGNEFLSPYSQNAAVEEIEQVFSLSSGMSSQVIFTAGSPASIEIPGQSVNVDPAGNLFIDDATPGVTYKVVSYIPYRDEGKLKNTSQEYPLNIRNTYLQLPRELPARVRELTEKLTAKYSNPYDKVKMIEGYLSANYPYDLSVAETPGGRDVADYFLFDLKKGYCTYHSTAMVVMLRSVGIPARWVKGFTTGTVNSETGVYQVDMGDAHSWVEVYFSDFGWLSFEPTPSFAIPGSKPSGEMSAAVSEPAPQAGEVPKVSPSEILSREEKRFPWATVIGILVVAVSAGAALYFRLTRNMFRMGSGDKIRDTYLAMVNLIGRKGYPKNASQTPIEFAASLSDKFPVDHQDIVCITDAYVREKYGRRKLSKSEVDEVQSIWRRLADRWLGRSRD